LELRFPWGNIASVLAQGCNDAIGFLLHLKFAASRTYILYNFNSRKKFSSPGVILAGNALRVRTAGIRDTYEQCGEENAFKHGRSVSSRRV